VAMWIHGERGGGKLQADENRTDPLSYPEKSRRKMECPKDLSEPPVETTERVWGAKCKESAIICGTRETKQDHY